MAVAEGLLVGPGDHRDALADGGRQLLPGPAGRAGLVQARRDAQAGAGLQRPAVRVLPGVPEPEDQRAQVVGLELPEDVAGAEPAADPQDHGLGQGTAAVGVEQSPVGQHAGDGVGVGVDAAGQLVLGRREGVEDVAPGGGVALPRPGHAGADALLEVLVRGHAVAPSRRSRRPGPTPPVPPRRRQPRPAPGDPEDSDPLRPCGAGPRGGPVRGSGVRTRRAGLYHPGVTGPMAPRSAPPGARSRCRPPACRSPCGRRPSRAACGCRRPWP